MADKIGVTFQRINSDLRHTIYINLSDFETVNDLKEFIHKEYGRGTEQLGDFKLKENERVITIWVINKKEKPLADETIHLWSYDDLHYIKNDTILEFVTETEPTCAEN